MRSWTRWVAVFALCSLVNACGTQPKVVFVQEAVDVHGEPQQIIKTVEPLTGDGAYFDGDKWVIVEDIEYPVGWLMVSPGVQEEPEVTEVEPEESE